MRKLFLTLISIFLVGSIFGTYKTFTLPAEVEERIAVLNYEHKGEFDYLAHLKASYLFEDITYEAASEPKESPLIPASPPSTPKYPAEIVDQFDFIFTYRFLPDQLLVNVISEEVEIKALIEKSGMAREEVILVPKTTFPGRFSAEFSLDASQLALSSITTITADVYTTAETMDSGLMFESFTQSLTIWSKGPLLEVDRNLASAQRASFGKVTYEQSGAFDYSVRLKWDSPFGAITLRPPAPPPPDLPPPPLPLSSKTLGVGDTMFTKLIEGMDITFSYSFESDEPVYQIDEEVEINAVLESPGAWSKTFALVPRTNKTGAFSVTFPLDPDDFSYFSDVYKVIEKETGVIVPRKVTIKADVRTIAQTDSGLIDEEFSQAVSTTLGEDVLDWQGKLVDSKPGTIERIRMAPNPERIVGLSVGAVRIVSALVTSIIFLLFLYLLELLYLNFWLQPAILSPSDEEALRARKKHKDVIADVKELPESGITDTVIKLDSLDGLIKVADNLLKPVLHKSEGDKHIYFVIDGSIMYEYVSKF